MFFVSLHRKKKSCSSIVKVNSSKLKSGNSVFCKPVHNSYSFAKKMLCLSFSRFQVEKERIIKSSPCTYKRFFFSPGFLCRVNFWDDLRTELRCW